jgi:hypothetical protein
MGKVVPIGKKKKEHGMELKPTDKRPKIASITRGCTAEGDIDRDKHTLALDDQGRMWRLAWGATAEHGMECYYWELFDLPFYDDGDHWYEGD